MCLGQTERIAFHDTMKKVREWDFILLPNYSEVQLLLISNDEIKMGHLVSVT